MLCTFLIRRHITASAKLCNDSSNFFEEKVLKIVANLELNLATCKLETIHVGPRRSTPANLSAFAQISLVYSEQVILICKSGSPDDPCLLQILASVVKVINPIFSYLLSLSIQSASVPLCWKEAKLVPSLKKPSADLMQLSNFRPISLLPEESKMLEKLVTSQLSGYLEQRSLLRSLQSGFKPRHSMETALLKVVDSIKLALDQGKLVALIQLDLSRAFDTVHSILMQHLAALVLLGKLQSSWLLILLTLKLSSFQCHKVEH